MTLPSSAHPLDVDLADLVDGLLDEGRREQVQEHVADCLLCRIKLRRLRDAAGEDPSDFTAFGSSFRDLAIAAPAFAVPDVIGPDDGAPQPGEIWAAGDEERILVFILGNVDEGRVMLAPVTFDADTADDETVVLDARRSPFRLPLAVYPTLRTDVPAAALRSRFGSIAAPDAIDRLLEAAVPGASRGTPILGPSDPRLELRQYLLDRLGALDEILPDPDTASDAPPPRPAHVASKLASDLRAWRGAACRVRALTSWDLAPVAVTRGWTPLLSVDEVGVLLVVFDTPSGLYDDADFNTARSVLTRFNATALVVLATALSRLADVFVPADLHEAIAVPSGERTAPRPSLSSLPPFDAVMKFLDQNSGWAASAWPSRATVTRVDVAAVLQASVEEALADVVAQGRRAHIPAKASGYSSTENLKAAFQSAIVNALSGVAITDVLAQLAEDEP
jgi:hypothetical protein